jgi:hypothetical protein
MIILGAGLSGCIASLMIPGSQVYEPTEYPRKHQALLRFKNDEISKALGIPFKKVKVYKGIRHNDNFVQLSPHYITRYARKTSQFLSHRSICNLDTEERYIAPKDFHEILLSTVKPRCNYNINTIKELNGPMISTLPINVLAEVLDVNIPPLRFSSIYISRYRIPDCDMHMTYYFTGSTFVYRASIVEDELIIESNDVIFQQDVNDVMNAFGLTGCSLELVLENYEQRYGKMVPWSDDERKKILFQLTKDFNIYSVGRFATWRNITLDDVYNDVLRIKSWVNLNEYDRVVK